MPLTVPEHCPLKQHCNGLAGLFNNAPQDFERDENSHDVDEMIDVQVEVGSTHMRQCMSSGQCIYSFNIHNYEGPEMRADFPDGGSSTRSFIFLFMQLVRQL